jgi:protein-tyrosine phosphatase
MIDIHSHILYGLDDGARSFEESLEMLRIATGAGTTDIVATPHANGQFPFSPDLIQERLSELRTAVGATIRIHSGCDFHLSYENIQDALTNPSKYTINSKIYLLVEFPENSIYRTARDIVAKLLEQGMVPIITHPERNRVLQGRMRDLQAWVEDGCLIQITAQSLLGVFGQGARKFAGSLLKDDLVHFVASDAHDCVRRPPMLDEAYQLVCQGFGELRATRLFVENSQKVLEGAAI